MALRLRRLKGPRPELRELEKFCACIRRDLSRQLVSGETHNNMFPRTTLLG